MCFSCYSVLQEVQNLLNNCLEFHHQIENGRQEMLYLIKEIENCFPSIIAADIFEITPKTFLSFFASIATYYIAMIQFNKANI